MNLKVFIYIYAMTVLTIMTKALAHDTFTANANLKNHSYADQDYFSDDEKLNKQALQSLIKISESGTYSQPILKDDLFCAKPNPPYTVAQNNVNRDSRLTPEQRASYCGINALEFRALQSYTEQDEPIENAALRDPRLMTKQIESQISYILSALKKIAPYKGITIRKTSLPKKELMAHLTQKEITNKAFTSASINLTYDRPKDVTMFIYVKNCKYTSSLSTVTTEQEVKCAPNSKFKIKAHFSKEIPFENSEINKKTHHYFLMEQII